MKQYDKNHNYFVISLTKAQMTGLSQGLYRIVSATTSLQSEIFACMERISVLSSPPAQEDVASINDRLNDVFTAYIQLQRRKGWLDAEE